ncbi:glycerol-3-phosphate dehydrogenase, mitochondrial-like [Sycon ciliatum]|uniref:glycerol-3-phosphate dehydrogenase, mitochondrial-like n=1 Tax=Sycon ciliatum TaxID=27933 RepID=UPI0020A8F77E|eukprot:scpid60232/ scgid34003/ Glycerol-3-phosphate dehydrogenase, mitochondrial
MFGLRTSCALAGAAAAGVTLCSDRNRLLSPQSQAQTSPVSPDPLTWRTRSRVEELSALNGKDEYDVVIIGGGATGSGVALDCASRGLKTALVEREDFASGTSARSTKLIHGGVRYLQNAIMKLDREQYGLVKEALHERANLLRIAPHLSQPLPIMLPVYRWWQVPYYYAGIKMYDFVAGRQCIKRSYFLSKNKALEKFPMLKKDKLCGAIVYYDGQQNDSRMCLAIALSAAREGATLANYVEVNGLIKEKSETDGGKEVIRGVQVVDRMTGEEFTIRAKCVVNATGPFTDSIRRMDDQERAPICQPSAGVHIVLPAYYSPASTGLLDPSTSDGRVIFFLPWQGRTIAGTTDSATAITDRPQPAEEDIQFILNEIRHYLSPDVNVRRGDVLAAWSGLRPLVSDPSSKNTASLSRNHVIDVSDSRLITIAGGKWTTYRSMAKDTVDRAVKVCKDLKPKRESATDGMTLHGGHGYTPLLSICLAQDYGLDGEVSEHLCESYGDRALEVAKLASLTGCRWPVVGRRLVNEFPYIEAEVRYAVRQEMALTAIDVIANRLRIAFLNVQAAQEVLPRVVDLMAEELKWNKAQKQAQLESAQTFLMSMGGKARKEIREVPINFSPEEITAYEKIFKRVDTDGDGHISIVDLRKVLADIGEEVSDTQLRELIAEVDTNCNSLIEFDEFLALMSAHKTGAVANNRLAQIVKQYRRIEVERSGGSF